MGFYSFFTGTYLAREDFESALNVVSKVPSPESSESAKYCKTGSRVSDKVLGQCVVPFVRMVKLRRRDMVQEIKYSWRSSSRGGLESISYIDGVGYIMLRLFEVCT